MKEEGRCDVPGIPRGVVFHGDFSFNTGKKHPFTFTDYMVLFATYLISAGFGIYQSWQNRHRGAFDYHLAGRTMGALPVAFSLLASFLSALTMMGGPHEIYNHDTMYFWLGVGFIFVVSFSAHVYIPVFYHLRITSAYEYLEMRFSRRVRVAVSCVFMLQTIIYLPSVIYIPSLAFEAVTGFDRGYTVIITGAICTIYTALGGIKGVIWADSFQISVMFVSLLVIFFRSAMKVGSWSLVWESADRTRRSRIFDFRLDPTIRHTVWDMVFGGWFSFLALYGANQVQVHRCLTCRTLKEAKIALWLNLPGQCCFIFLCCFIGLYMGAFYENCDPFKAKLVESENMVFPTFVMDILGDTAGLPGLYFAGFMSATLSTVSSGLNSIAAVILEDYLRAYSKTRVKEQLERIFSQVISIVFGFICTEIGFLLATIKPTKMLQSIMSLNGILASPVLGVFSLGFFFPCANAKGALFGLFGSIGFVSWLSLKAPDQEMEIPLKCVSNCNITVLHHLIRYTTLEPETTPFTAAQTGASAVYSISYMWYPLLAFSSCITIGLIVSKMTGFRNPLDVDPRLIVPVVDVIFPFFYLPESTKKKFRSGIDHGNKFSSNPKQKQYINDWGSATLNLAMRRMSFSSETSASLSRTPSRGRSCETQL